MTATPDTPRRLPARRRVLAGATPRCPGCRKALPNLTAECAGEECRKATAAREQSWAKWNRLMDHTPRPRWRDLFKRNR